MSQTTNATSVSKPITLADRKEPAKQRKRQKIDAAMQPQPAVQPDVVVAIDYGTTTCSVTILRAGKADHPSFPGSGQTLPSVIQFDPDGTIRVGKAAENAAAKCPANTHSFIKRQLPLRPDEPLFSGRSPKEATALILSHIWDAVLKCDPSIKDYIPELGGTKDRSLLVISITCPATFTLQNQQDLREAGNAVGNGLTVDEIIPESVAASFTIRERLGLTLKPGQTLLVLDFGGGTFDIALMELGDDGTFHQRVGGKGDPALGGMDVSLCLFVLLCEAAGLDWSDAYDPGYGLHVDRIPEKFQRMAIKAVELCELAKKEISATDQTVQYVDAPEGTLEFQVERDLFMERLKEAGFYDRFSQAIASCLEGTDLSFDTIDFVALVGGTALLPGLLEIVARLTNRSEKAIEVAGDPQHTISYGAALSGQYREAAALCLPGGLGYRLRDLVGPSDWVNKFVFHSGESIDPGGTRVDELGQMIHSKGGQVFIEITFVEAKSGVAIPPSNGGAVLVDDDQCVIVNNVIVALDQVPAGEHAVEVSFFFARNKRLFLQLSLPALPELDSYTVAVGDAGTQQNVTCIGYDLVLALDCSGSMSRCLSHLQEAAEWLLNDLQHADVRIGLVCFGLHTGLVAPLGTPINDLRHQINGLVTAGGTPMKEALEIVHDHLTTEHDPNRERMTVLLTDGVPRDPQATAVQADLIKTHSMLRTIGIGPGVDEVFLRHLATSPSHYKFAEKPTDLQGIVQELSSLILDAREYE